MPQGCLKTPGEVSAQNPPMEQDITYCHLLSGEALDNSSIALSRSSATALQSKASVRSKEPAEVVPRVDEIWRLSIIF